jgi:hypothetical protein
VAPLPSNAGFRPAYTFDAAVEQTYEWFRRAGLAETHLFDWAWEDRLLASLKDR